jgi:putative redox protein
MELVLMGVAGCSAIDMISILKKQRQEITSFKAEVEGERCSSRRSKTFKRHPFGFT